MDSNSFNIDLNYSLNLFNYSTNISNNDEFPRHQATRTIELVFCVVVFFIGMIVNSLVCVVVFRKRQMQTPLNMFLVTLAIADMLLCTFYIITLPTYYLFDSWIFGTTLYFMTTFVIELYDFYSIIIISVSMCLFVFQKVNLKKAFITIGITCLSGTLISLVKLRFTDVVTIDEKNYCFEDWPNDIVSRAYQLLKLLTNILLPVVTLIVVLVLSLILKFNKNPLPSRMLMLIMIIYVLLWSPLTVLHSFVFGYIENMVDLFHNLSLLAVVFKPILYYLMDKTMKNEFIELCKCRKINPPEVYNLHSK